VWFSRPKSPRERGFGFPSGPPPVAGAGLGPPLTSRYIPQLTPGELGEYERTDRIRRERTGGHILVGALLLYLLSIPVSLLVVKVVAENTIGGLSWGDFFAAIQEAELLSVFIFGISGQIAFAAVASVGASFHYSHKRNVAVLMIIAGFIGMAFSVLVFGGVVGIVGGVLSIAGGLQSRPRSQPMVNLPPSAGPPAP